MKLIITLFFITLFSTQAIAQKGTLTGNVIDEKSGEEIIGVNIYIPELSTGATTDVSGRYSIQLDPGTYNVEYSYISYQKQIVTDVEIEAGKTTEIDIALGSESEELDEVMVSASRIDNNEVSLLKAKVITGAGWNFISGNKPYWF